MLTTEQIEIQRRKFEKAYEVPVGIFWVDDDEEIRGYCFDSYEPNASYQECCEYIDLWVCWLSCVESNEIELPPTRQIEEYGEYYDVIDAINVVRAIEAQGFTVKV